MSLAKISKISAVEICVLKSKPPQLALVATGQVSSAGWSRSALLPYVYLNPPADGIYDFDFVAERPPGIVPRALTPIAVIDIMPLIDGARGVRLHASTNAIVAMISGGPNGSRGLAAMLVAATP